MPSPLISDISLQRDEALKAIRDIASLINANNDYYGLLDRIVRTICDKLVWSRSAIMILDREKGLSRLVAFRDLGGTPSQKVETWDLIRSPTLSVAKTRKPLILQNAQNDDRFPDYRDFAIQHGLNTFILLPLSSTDMENREMVFSVAMREQIDVDQSDLDFLLTISHLISIAVDKHKMFQAELAANDGFRSLFDSNSRLMHRIVSGCSFNELVEAVGRQLKLPFAVSDELSASFVWSGRPAAIAELPEGSQGEATERLAELLREIIPHPDIHSVPTKIAVHIDAETIEVDVVVLPLLIGDQMLGGFVVFPNGRSPGEFEMLLAQGGQQAMSAYLMRTYAPWTQKATAIAAFFGSLFDGDWQSFDQIQNMAQRVGVDLSFPAQFLAVNLQPVIAESMILCRAIETASKQILPNSEAFYESQVLYIYFPIPQRGAGKTVSRLAAEISSQVKWRTGVEVTTTLTDPCESQIDFKAVRSHCRQVFRLAQLFEKKGFLSLADFGSFAILVSALGDAAMTNFLSETLDPILRHDAEKNSALLQCSEAFLRNACRYQAAADALDIHVSTLRYRLKRVNELFNLDLENNEDDRFALSLALRIRQLRT